MPNLTINNISTSSFEDIQAQILPLLDQKIDVVDLDMNAIEQQLAEFANIYVWIMALWAQVSEDAQRMKLGGNTSQYHVLTRRREILFEYAKAAKLKHATCSRIVTIEMGVEEPFERANVSARRERHQKKGWGSV